MMCDSKRIPRVLRSGARRRNVFPCKTKSYLSVLHPSLQCGNTQVYHRQQLLLTQDTAAAVAASRYDITLQIELLNK